MADDWQEIPVDDDDWEDVPTDDAVEAYSKRSVSALNDAGRAVLSGVGKASRAVDSVTGAPIRAGIGALQEGKGIGGAFSAAKDQFLDDPSNAPSGKDIAAKAGLSTEETIPSPLIMNPWSPKDNKLSPAGIAGAGIETVADPLNFVGGGAAMGATKLAGKLGKAVNPRVIKYLDKLSKERAVKAATGHNTKAIKQMNDLEGVGLDLLSADEAGDAVIGPLSNVESIAPKAREKMQFYGGKIQELSDKLDTAQPNSVSGEAIAKKIEEYRDEIPDLPHMEGLRNKLTAQVDAYRKRGDMSFKDAQGLKNSYKYKFGEPQATELGADAMNRIKGFVGKEMDDAAGRVAALPVKDADELAGEQVRDFLVQQGRSEEMPMYGGTNSNLAIDIPGLKAPEPPQRTITPDTKEILDKYQTYKKKYGSHKKATDASESRVKANLANRILSPSDYGTGLATAAADMASGGAYGALKGLAAGAVHKQVRERGSAFAAKSAQAIAQKLTTGGEMFTKYLPLMEKAALHGPSGVVAYHHVLLNNDPEYKKMMADL